MDLDILLSHLNSQDKALQLQACVALHEFARRFKLVSTTTSQLLEHLCRGWDSGKDPTSAPAGGALLHSPHPAVRAAALTLLCSVAPPPAVPRLCAVFAKDDDLRVREAALRGLLRACRAGRLLPSGSLHTIASDALLDLSPRVRLQGVWLLWACCLHGCTRHEATFDLLCSLIKDPSVPVKAAAISLLSRIRNVPERHLLDTFAQESIEIAVQETEEQRRRRQTLGLGPAPDAVEEPEQSWATGAFVQAMEDEFQEVRQAAIASVCTLSTQHKTFQSIAVDFLIDMFNDEIDCVRIGAIRAVAKLCGDRPFTDAQLTVVLANLQDASPAVRGATLELLRCAALPSPAALLAALRAVTAEAARDRPAAEPAPAGGAAPGASPSLPAPDLPRPHLPQILATAQQLALHHPMFPLVEDLLQLGSEPDAKFLLKCEPSPTDVSYIVAMAFLVNCATKNPAVLPALPDYCLAHLPFLRRRWPPYFPALQYTHIEAPSAPLVFTLQPLQTPETTNPPPPAIFVKDATVRQHPLPPKSAPRRSQRYAEQPAAEDIVLVACQHVDRLWAAQRQQALQVIAEAVAELQQIAEWDVKALAQVEMYSLYLEVVRSFLLCQSAGIPRVGPQIQAALRRILALFLPLDVRWRLHLLELLALATLLSHVHGEEPPSSLEQCLRAVRTLCDTHDLLPSQRYRNAVGAVDPDPGLSPARRTADIRPSRDGEPERKRPRGGPASPLSADQRDTLALRLLGPPPVPDAMCAARGALRKLHAEVMVPASSEHSPLTVCSRTPLSLAVCGIVRNHHITPRPGTLALKVEVPSQPPAFFLVRPEDMHVAQPFLYRVAMTVRVGVFSWTRPVALVVTLVAMQPGTSPGDFAYEACSAISEGRKVYVQTS